MKPIASVLGAGSFGTAMANILAKNGPVFLWGRNSETLRIAEETRMCSGQELHDQVYLCDSLEKAAGCEVILPILPGHAFREVLVAVEPYLRRDHLLVHGTKGVEPSEDMRGFMTMGELIKAVTGIRGIGCLAGPNLAREIAEGKPAATVVASSDSRILNLLPDLLRSPRFQVLVSDDLYGIELSGILKNIMAIAAGSLHEFGLGENARALLVNRGMVEMAHLGVQMGASLKSFLGVAGMGDLMATCSSLNSRNFTVGRYLAQGKSTAEIQGIMEETAEGINTTRLIHRWAMENNARAPITRVVYKVLFEEFPAVDAINLLMKVPVREDIDFI